MIKAISNQRAAANIPDMTESVKKPRMRGIREAVEEIKNNDPESIMTYDRLMRIVHRGDIPSIKLGTRYIINMDMLYQYLYNGSTVDVSKPNGGGIRVIKE